MSRFVTLGVLAMLVWGSPFSALAQSTTFRVANLQDMGDKLEVTLAVQQGSQPAPIDVYLHGKLPRHRNVNSKFGPLVDTGMHLGQINPTPKAGESVTHKLTISLADLMAHKAVGVDRGGTLYFAIKLPEKYLGGHEWGVHDGSGGLSGSYCASTHIDIPQAQQNSRLGRRAGARLRFCFKPLVVRPLLHKQRGRRASTANFARSVVRIKRR